MSDRPPSPLAPPSPRPTASSATGSDTVADADPNAAFDRRVVVTTPQLAAAIEDSLGVSLDADAFEDLLVELDRNGYVEWLDVARSGEYVWDLSGSPDRIAETVAEVAVDRLCTWLAADS